jgi:hypothetical protein
LGGSLSLGESLGGKELHRETVTKIPVAIILNDDANKFKEAANNSLNGDGDGGQKSNDCVESEE